jgi:hypothetical protein
MPFLSAANIHEERRPLARVGLLLKVIVAKENRATGGDGRGTDCIIFSQIDVGEASGPWWFLLNKDRTQ